MHYASLFLWADSTASYRRHLKDTRRRSYADSGRQQLTSSPSSASRPCPKVPHSMNTCIIGSRFHQLSSVTHTSIIIAIYGIEARQSPRRGSTERFLSTCKASESGELWVVIKSKLESAVFSGS